MIYWQRYDARYKLCNVKNLYYFIQSKARKLGRPSALNPYEYTAVFIISTFFDLSLRDEFLSDLIFGKHIDHRTFGKAFQKIPHHCLQKLLLMIRSEIKNLIGKKHIPISIADSTEVTTDRLYVPAIIKCKSKRRKLVDKLNIVAEYYPEENAIVIANADAFLTSDSYFATKMLSEIETNATILFADAGFDCEELYEKCFSIGIKPIIKQRRYDKKQGNIEGGQEKYLMESSIREI